MKYYLRRYLRLLRVKQNDPSRSDNYSRSVRSTMELCWQARHKVRKGVKNIPLSNGRKIKLDDLLVDVAAVEVNFELLRRDHGILLRTTYGSLWCA